MKILLSAIALVATATVAHAVTYTTSVTIGYDPNAATSNFGSPGSTNSETAYTVRTGVAPSNFLVDVTTTGPNGGSLGSFDFANIYVGGAHLSPGLIFEVTNDRVSTTANPGLYYSLAGTGFNFTSTTDQTTGVLDIAFALPLSFLENDPLNIGFSKLVVGDQVRVSYAQAFGYSFVGGSGHGYGDNRLGSQIIPPSVPEPATWALMLIGVGGAGAMLRRRSALALA